MKPVFSQASHSSYRYHVLPLEGFPDLLAFHQLNPDRYPFLLESVIQDNSDSRYDLLLAFPQSNVSTNGKVCFLDELDKHWKNESALSEFDGPEYNKSEEIPPFRGGWFVFLSYELVNNIEPTLGLNNSDSNVPQAVLVRCPAAIIRDHKLKSCYFICESDYAGQIVQMQQDAKEIKPVQSTWAPESILKARVEEEAESKFLEGVSRIKQYIKEGDVFQVNLSRLWRVQLNKNTPAHVLYQKLRKTNPSPFAGLARLAKDTYIISSSPERLVKTRGNKVTTRPIAGTYPRGSSKSEDQKLAKSLVLNPKERAEHIMLIDLERNDLGKVCQSGSVEVSDFMVIETYEHVHHIVSQVEGRLKPNVDPKEIIAAVFPGGTITGCPKVRCMEIINELEDKARGAYTGAMGYLNRDGDMDLNILIRSITQHEDQIYFRAGSGIVADSVPENELAETRNKARGLLRIFG